MSKWYLDCVTDSGDVSVAYSGTVEWGPLHLNYCSLLQSAGPEIAVRHTLRKQRQPAVEGGSVLWNSKSLGVDALWQGGSHRLAARIYSNEEGFVDWECVKPCAKARFGSRAGLGYAERLTMTIPPWKIPIDALLWGRFTSESDSIVWIDWQRKSPQRVVYLNGELTPTSILEPWRVEFDNGALLTMKDPLVLRDGQLGTNALAAIPGIKSTFPARLLQVNECKWRSTGFFRWPNGKVVEGWVIHEKVTWPS